MIKHIALFLLAVSSFYTANSQFIEFGGGLGVNHYTGDLNPAPRISQSRLGFTGIYRMNLSEIVSFKLALTAGKIAGNDENPIDALGEARDFSFEHTLIELSSVFEYHFVDYRVDNNRNKFVPFIFLGFGLTNVRNVVPTFEDFSRIQPVIPMGGGVKYILSKRLTLGFEAGARRTFFDYLDGISDGDVFIKENYRFGNPNDKDWYFYSGINLTYVLHDIPCPFPYVPNRSILNRIKGF